jgi:hypothetical protein
MTYEPGAYRRPYRRGDYHLVDTSREGTYWQSTDGVVVRIASGERARSAVRGEQPAPLNPLWLFTRLAGQ